MAELVINLEIEDASAAQFTFVQTCYGIPCFVFMVLALLFLSVKKRFSFPLYKLARMDLLVNICIYLNTWLAMRLEKFTFCIPMLKWIEVICPGLLTFSRYLTNYFFHLQFLSCAIMTVNRIMTLKGVNGSTKFWNWFCLIFFVSACLYSPLPNYIFYRGFPSRTSIINGTLYRIRNEDKFKAVALSNAVFSTVYFFLMAILGGYSIVLFKRLKVTPNSPVAVKTLTQVTITYSVVYSGILLYCVLNGIDAHFPFYPSRVREASTVVLGYTSDMMTLSLPFILLWHDGNVKKELRRKITPNVGGTFTAM